MCDILIVRRRDRAVIIPESEKGEAWIRDNIYNNQLDPCLSINVEFVQELINDYLKPAGLIVEE